MKESERSGLENAKKDGIIQLEKYIKEKIKGRIKKKDLKKAVMVVIGKNEIVTEYV